MRKVALLFFVVIILFSSCNNKPQLPNNDFSAQVDVEYNEVNIKGNIVMNKNKMMQFSVTYPDSMAGYTYCYKDGKLEIKYGNMVVSGEENYLPQNSFCKILYNVLISLSDESNCTLINSTSAVAEYRGSCINGNYLITCEYCTGAIRKIFVEDLSFVACFTNISITN